MNYTLDSWFSKRSMHARVGILSFLFLLTIHVVGSPTFAAVILADDFEDGDRTNNPAWYSAGIQANFTVDVVDDSVGLGSGNAMRIDYTSGHSGSSAALLRFTPITLANDGDYIEASFDMRYVDVDSSGGAIGNALRMGFFDDNGTVTMQDGSATFLANNGQDPDDGFGYGVAVDALSASGSVAEFYRFRPNLGIFNTNFGADAFGASSSSDLLIGTDPQRVSLRIEYTTDATDGTSNPADLLVTFTRNATSVTFSIGDDPSVDYDPETLTFADFNFGNRTFNGGNDDVIIDNVQITTNVIPEPNTAALLGLACIGSLACIRRRDG